MLSELFFDFAQIGQNGLIALGLMTFFALMFGIAARWFAGHFIEAGLFFVMLFVVMIVAGALSTEANNFMVGLIAAIIGILVYALGMAFNFNRHVVDIRV